MRRKWHRHSQTQRFYAEQQKAVEVQLRPNPALRVDSFLKILELVSAMAGSCALAKRRRSNSSAGSGRQFMVRF